jgi:hypothetical protein
MQTRAELDGYSAAQFETWLDRRFRDQYRGNESEKYRAFDFRSLGVERGASNLDDVTDLVATFGPETKARFIEGLENLLRHADPDDFPVQGMRDITALIGLLRAFHAVYAFAPVFGSGQWGVDHPELLYEAISVLLGFEPSNKAYEAARDLAAKKNFHPRYIIDTYTVLFRIKPERWATDLKDHWGGFVRLANAVKASSDPGDAVRFAARQRLLAEDLAYYVSPEGLAAHIGELPLAPPNGFGWLLQCLFDREGPLWLVGEESTGEWRIIDRGDPTKRGTLSMTPHELRITCRDLKLVRFVEFADDTGGANKSASSINDDSLRRRFEHISSPDDEWAAIARSGR